MTREAPDLPAPDYEFEERAAIMEYEGGISREEAEYEAAKIVAMEPKIVAEARTILSSALARTGKDYFASDDSEPETIGLRRTKTWRDYLYSWPELAEMDVA
jgi:hypothetical protein